MKADERVLAAGNAREIGPDDVVENVAAKRIDGGAQRMHAQRTVAAAGDGVDHQGQRSDMIEMRMREHDIVDARHLDEGQIADAGAGVDQQIVVHEERSRPAVLRDGTRAAQHTHLHRRRPLCCFTSGRLNVSVAAGKGLFWHPQFQAWTNCILVPPSSSTSPSCSITASLPSFSPLSVVPPSIGAMT